jgi:hypothetical protein
MSPKTQIIFKHTLKQHSEKIISAIYASLSAADAGIFAAL